MIIECIGLPKSGKSSFARSAPPEVLVVPQEVPSRYTTTFLTRYPLFSFVYVALLLLESLRTRTLPLLRFKLSLFKTTIARFAYAQEQKGNVVLDEGCLQRILSLYERARTKKELQFLVQLAPRGERIVLLEGNPEELLGAPARARKGEQYLKTWRQMLAGNLTALTALLPENELVRCSLQEGKPVCSRDAFASYT